MVKNPGERLGPYEILALIGAGGMGEVYRARDTKLGRDVAIKVLPPAFAADPARMARFEREARVLASLNHNNIAHIYGVEEGALVMELVEGESPKGPMPFEDAWKIAAQIAGALEYAHEKNIVHRDLKPANIKIAPDGTVKVLDFGLAKVAVPESAAVSENSPTLTMGATHAGMVLGTAAYMSPEQARGKIVDKRTDIWAFGVVLFEVLSGERPFQGKDVPDLLASVLKDEPKWDPIERDAQPLLRKCLAKDPKQRLRDIGDAALLLRGSADASAPGRARSWLAWTATAAALLALVGLWITNRIAPRDSLGMRKASLLYPDAAVPTNYAVPAISPDGKRVAFFASSEGNGALGQLFVRDLDSLAARPLAGTSGAAFPFWSPDGKFIGFFADGKLKKVDAQGAPPVTLAEANFALGGSWSKQDVILCRTDPTGLRRVSAQGGESAAATRSDSSGAAQEGDQLPWFLPDGRHFLYTSVMPDGSKSTVYVADLNASDPTQTRRKVVEAVSNAVYSAGYLLFVQERTLMAQPFDLNKLQVTGDPSPVAEQINYRAGGPDCAFSASQNGTLVYSSGDAATEVQLTWFDRSGKVLGKLGAPASQLWPAISPDGTRVAIDRRDHPRTGFFEIWMFDLKQNSPARFTFNSDTFVNVSPVWSPDGNFVAFSSSRSGARDIYRKPVNGGQEELLHGADARSKAPSDWSRDGKYIIETVADPKTKDDIWVLPLTGDRKPYPYLQTEAREDHGKLSPNGLWLAYSSNESKTIEIYVQSFPKAGSKRKISTDGGTRPVWSRDGKELYYWARNNRTIMGVPVNSGPNFEAGAPHPLFDARQAGTGSWFDVGKDGRFLVPVQPEPAMTRSMTVVFNWTAGLKR